MSPVEVVILSGVFTIVSSALAWFLARRERREKDVQVASTPTPPTTQEVWQRQDKLERVVRSAVILLGEVAEQWPHDHVPILSKRHVAVLAEEGYMPPEWDPPTE